MRKKFKAVKLGKIATALAWLAISIMFFQFMAFFYVCWTVR